MTRSMVAAKVGLLTADCFLSGVYGRMLWLRAGLCCALYALSRRMEAAASAP